MKNTALFGILALFVVASIMSPDVFAEGSESYKMAGDVSPVLTFAFRDGIETYEFPVFNMGENFIDNSGVSFSVEGTVTKSPLLHEAMDEAYKYRSSNAAFDYQLKYFDVTADFVKADESTVSLNYNNCRVDNYQVETLDSNHYGSYFKKVGFAVVDKIDFVCSGVNFNNDSVSSDFSTNFGESEFNFANNVRTSVIFIYDYGTETIQFPVFNLISGYEENPNTPEFYVEGVLDYYPLLFKAIDNSRSVSGSGFVSNPDFDAKIEFTNGETVLRGLDFADCIMSDAKIATLTDKEEGFTGKSGFAVAHQLNVVCAGFSPVNMNYDALIADAPMSKTRHLTNQYVDPLQNTDKGLDVFATFNFGDMTEIVEFSMFKQNEILTSTEKVNQDNGQKALAADAFTRKATYPTLELRGIVGDYPMLYNYVDENRQTSNIGGATFKQLMNIDIDIMSDGETLRGFNYVNCRATNYVIDTDAHTEESYIKNKFALENIFDFECQGYRPNNSAYDAMFVVEQADTESSGDLRNTDRWGSQFTVRE